MKLLAFAVIFLHILILPLVISADIAVDTDRMTGKIKVKLFFIPVYVKAPDLSKFKNKINERARERSDKSEKERSNKKGVGRYLMRVIKCFLSRIRARVIDINGVLGSGDAAVTAVAVGSITAGYDSARAVMGFDGDCDIRTEYDYERIFVEFYGIISFCLADTIFALIAAAFGGRRSNTARREVYG